VRQFSNRIQVQLQKLVVDRHSFLSCSSLVPGYFFSNFREFFGNGIKANRKRLKKEREKERIMIYISFHFGEAAGGGGTAGMQGFGTRPPSASGHEQQQIEATFFRAIGALFGLEQESSGAPPAAKEALNRLEREKFLKTSTDSDDKCPVCFELYEQAHDVVKLPCGHEFHLECVKTWLQAHDSCPICRAHVSTDSDREKEPQHVHGPAVQTEQNEQQQEQGTDSVRGNEALAWLFRNLREPLEQEAARVSTAAASQSQQSPPPQQQTEENQGGSPTRGRTTQEFQENLRRAFRSMRRSRPGQVQGSDLDARAHISGGSNRNRFPFMHWLHPLANAFNFRPQNIEAPSAQRGGSTGAEACDQSSSKTRQRSEGEQELESREPKRRKVAENTPELERIKSDLRGCCVRTLKSLVTSLGLDHSRCVEKSELVDMAAEEMLARNL